VERAGENSHATFLYIPNNIYSNIASWGVTVLKKRICHVQEY